MSFAYRSIFDSIYGMKIDIVTLFPEMIQPFVETSILGRSQKAGAFEVRLHQLRDWALDKHHTVDDTPYGGGPGMVIKIEVVDRALFDLKSKIKNQKSKVQRKMQNELIPHVILMTPQGRPFSQQIAHELSIKGHLILVAGHYEGFDERIRTLVDDEISIGDYVLTGGELPAMVVTDAVVRLLPGVLGTDASSHEESFFLTSSLEISNSSVQSPKRLLEYPQYTRPESYQPSSISDATPLVVPDILKSGHHAAIEAWRLEQAKERTKTRRPDLLN